MTIEREALKLALEDYKKNERHNTVAETRYWCNQYKLLAEQALAQEQEPTDELHSCPYAEEIHGDYWTLCDCDEERTRQCAQDI